MDFRDDHFATRIGPWFGKQNGTGQERGMQPVYHAIEPRSLEFDIGKIYKNM